MEWISVKDKLPEESGKYLTVVKRVVDPEHRADFGDDDRIIRITTYQYGDDHELKWFIPYYSPEWINNAITDTVTHWAELPELPPDLPEDDSRDTNDTGKLKCGWGRDYDGMTDGLTAEYPCCPKCGEPLYETDKCVFCGQEIDQDDEKLQCWLEPPEVETTTCFQCGGTMEYIKSKYNGHRHGRCLDCGMTFME